MSYVPVLLSFVVGACIGGMVVAAAHSRRRTQRRHAKQSVSSRVAPLAHGGGEARPVTERSTDEYIEFAASPAGISYKGSRYAVPTAVSFLLLTVLAGVAAAAVWALVNVHFSQSPPGPPVVILLQPTFDRMQKGIETNTYTVEPHPNTEVIQGLSGRYYDIDFRSASAQASIFFGPKKYVRNEFDSDFKASVTAFRHDVLNRIVQGRVPYRIFVQGSADNMGNDLPMLDTLFEGAAKDIWYLPLVPGFANLYSRDPVQQHVPVKYQNVHLPNLRAAFLQEKLAAYNLESSILEGTVNENPGDKYRNATMLLYVKWPRDIVTSHP